MTYNNEYCYSLLQQHLPFTVLKPTKNLLSSSFHLLQQHLPFTVLKLPPYDIRYLNNTIVATALTVYGIETGCGSSDHLIQTH